MTGAEWAAAEYREMLGANLKRVRNETRPRVSLRTGRSTHRTHQPERSRITMSIPTEYRKKPVVIEAMQWDGSAESATPIINWALESDGPAIRYHEHLMDGDLIAHPDPFLWVDTLEGRMIATTDDFIIKGVNGEFYPCKPDIFAKTYEEVL